MFNKLVSVALLVVVVFVLSGCAQTLSGLQDTKVTKARPANLPQPDSAKQSDGSARFVALQTEISLNDTRSGYLDSSNYQPWDTYVIRNVSRGTRVIVELSGPSNTDFDLYVWSDGAWVADCSTSVGCTYSSNERVEFTTSSSTDIWIFPYAYSGSGRYTLTIKGQTTARWSKANLQSKYYTDTRFNPFADPNRKPTLIGECTWYVYGRIQEVGLITQSQLQSYKNWTGKNSGQWIFLGHAKTWYWDAQAAGLATGTKPREGAIAVWTSGDTGHVAFVESVNNDGTFNVSESNWRCKKCYGERQNVSPSGLTFIYLR